jgi:hypothetical protein
MFFSPKASLYFRAFVAIAGDPSVDDTNPVKLDCRTTERPEMIQLWSAIV